VNSLLCTCPGVELVSELKDSESGSPLYEVVKKRTLETGIRCFVFLRWLLVRNSEPTACIADLLDDCRAHLLYSGLPVVCQQISGPSTVQDILNSNTDCQSPANGVPAGSRICYRYVGRTACAERVLMSERPPSCLVLASLRQTLPGTPPLNSAAHRLRVTIRERPDSTTFQSSCGCFRGGK
jgi:hypothetical protein